MSDKAVAQNPVKKLNLRLPFAVPEMRCSLFASPHFDRGTRLRPPCIRRRRRSGSPPRPERPSGLRAKIRTRVHKRKIGSRRMPTPYFLVEMTGFEPAASSSRTKRATKLRYISICICRGGRPRPPKTSPSPNRQTYSHTYRSKPTHYSMLPAVCQWFFGFFAGKWGRIR